MPRGLRVPKLPRFGAPQSPASSPGPVRVKATSVHGIPIELRVNPGAQAFSRPFSYSSLRRPSFAAFARALDPGVTAEVEAFCAPAAPVRAPNALPAPKVSTPNPLPDGALAPVTIAPPPAPVGVPVPPGPANDAPSPVDVAPPTLEELAALAEIREGSGPFGTVPAEAPFPPPPSPPSKEDAPAQPPAAPKPSQGASLSYGHEVFDRMAPPMAMTFDAGNVSLERRFSQMDSRLDREARLTRASSRAPNVRSAAASLDDHSLAQDLAAMRWSNAYHHHAGTEVKAGPAPEVPEAPPVKASPVADVPVAKTPAKETVTPPSPTTTAQVVDPAALIAGDVIVASEAATNGAPAATHTLLFLGDGQVVEAASTGMAVRSVTQALAGVECAIALRNNPAAWGANAGEQPSVLVYIGHLKAPATK